jgi:RNA processing factor Prp31
MVIQSIALLDQLDKDINLFGMRIKEWYAYHFPELIKIVPDLYKYVRCTTTIMNRENMDEQVEQKIKGF